jgi:beta-lactamase family protein
MAIFFRSRALRVAPLAVMLMSDPVSVSAQTSTEGDPTIVRDLDAFIERVMATDLTPGIGVAVVRGTDVIYAKGFGFADRERSRRATADTQFYVASTTKSFTALAGAVLASRGLIDPTCRSPAHCLERSGTRRFRRTRLRCAIFSRTRTGSRVGQSRSEQRSQANSRTHNFSTS